MELVWYEKGQVTDTSTIETLDVGRVARTFHALYVKAHKGQQYQPCMHPSLDDRSEWECTIAAREFVAAFVKEPHTDYDDE